MIQKESNVTPVVRSQRHEISDQFNHDVDRKIGYFNEAEKQFVYTGKYNFIGRASALSEMNVR